MGAPPEFPYTPFRREQRRFHRSKGMTSGNGALELDGTWELMVGEKGGYALPETSVWRARMVVEAGVFSLRAGADVLRGAFHPAPADGPGPVDAVVAEG